MSFIVEPEPKGLPAIGRRGFLAGSVAAGGFALAVQPVTAQTITTPSEGLTEGMVEIDVAGTKIPAYRAHPAGAVNSPVVLVVHEIFGVHEHIKDVCRRLAKAGYYAIATELYFRQGDPQELPMAEIMPLVAKVPDAQVMGDLDATVAFARAEGAAADRLAITGFCWGGRVVWLYAAHNPALKAGVAWYGRVMGTTDPLHPQNPIDLAGALKAPVLGLYGGADQGIPIDSVRQMEAAARAAGKTVEVTIYPDTPHAFHADYRPSYREAAAKDGWAKLLDFLKKNGV